MPYEALEDLADSVKAHLPKHAREIYQEACNSAWRPYKHKEDKRGDTARVGEGVAWSAVKLNSFALGCRGTGTTTVSQVASLIWPGLLGPKLLIAN
jgi:cation transport regulator